MTFDPAAFENLDALKAKQNSEADEAQINAKIATEGVDYDGARELMYGDLQPRTPGEIEAAKIAEANEPSPDDILMTELEGKEVISGTLKTIVDKGAVETPVLSRSTQSDIRNRIALRSGKEDDGEQLDDRSIDVLDNTENREANSKVAKNLFFSQENLAAQAESSSHGNSKEKKQTQEWIDANLGEQGVLTDSLLRIEGNFILPKGVEGENMKDIYSKYPNRVSEVNSALSDAVELEVCAITKGKINYDTVAVNRLVVEIHDSQSTPLEKIQKFAQIHTKVNTSIARGGKTQTEAFRKKQAQASEAAKQEEGFQNMKKIDIQATVDSTELIDKDPITNDSESVNNGEIFTASNMELANKSAENPTESA